MKVDWQEYTAAAVVIVFGLALAAVSLTYPLGSLLRPGPGFVPLMVGCIIAALGAAIVLEVRGQLPVPRDYKLRPLLTVSAGLVLFGLLVERAGFVPATVVLIAMTGLGERNPRWLPLIGVAAFVCAFGIALFIWGLGVPLNAFGALR